MGSFVDTLAFTIMNEGSDIEQMVVYGGSERPFANPISFYGINQKLHWLFYLGNVEDLLMINETRKLKEKAQKCIDVAPQKSS